MADPRGPVRQGTVRRTAAVVVLGALALCLGGGVAWALWADGGVAAGPTTPVTAWSVPVTTTTCSDTDGPLFETAAVTWPETSTPRALAYTATINGVAASVTDNGATRSVAINQTVLQQLFGGLFGSTLTVRVTAALPGTAWTAPVATETVQAGVTALPPGLTLECASPP
ncbi:hypothetical protein ACFS27_14155 [Promicromonospora vindobonensis]|uniref:Uncharacterized protein n=1 Tax=Promicromonospora vindobonensis TaxID=195748 RepID=A0ABW5VSM6_9MICO